MTPWKHGKFIVKLVTDRVPAEFVPGKRLVIGDGEGPACALAVMPTVPPPVPLSPHMGHPTTRASRRGVT
jgi:hypothetical protein